MSAFEAEADDHGGLLSATLKDEWVGKYKARESAITIENRGSHFKDTPLQLRTQIFQLKSLLENVKHPDV